MHIFHQTPLFPGDNGGGLAAGWASGLTREVLKGELVVSGGGGAVMQMPVPVEALESDITINYESGSLMTRARIYSIKRKDTGPVLKRWSTSLTWLPVANHPNTIRASTDWDFVKDRTKELVRVICHIYMIFFLLWQVLTHKKLKGNFFSIYNFAGDHAFRRI